MKILNLYSGIGGNRMMWGDEHQITSIEYDSKIAHIYSQLFPGDELIIADAKEYLLNNYKDFDLIWASPPCQSHSRARLWEPKFIDLSLYQIIIFLQNHFDGAWVVENVIPYYEPLIKPNSVISRHNFWSNINLNDILISKKEQISIETAKVEDFAKYYNIDLNNIEFKKGTKKVQIFRNMVEPEIGKLILDRCIKPITTLLEYY